MRNAIHPDAPYRREAVVTRFWGMVDQSGGPDACWPWTGYRDGSGYGLYFYEDRKQPAHRLARSFATGEGCPDGFEACHSCDCPPCCNPKHLRFDSRQGNVDDMTGRGRQARGERNGHSKLTERDVVAIRERAAAGATGKSLAEDYGVSQGLVNEILKGKRWKHAGGPIREAHGNQRHGRYAQEKGTP